MDIYDEIRQKQQIAEDLFKKALSPTLNEMVNDIKKAKASPVGTVSTHGGIKMRKEANGWVPVKNGSKSPKEGESEGSDQASPEALAEHAKNASEGALLNATKVSADPKIREAAHKELMRRKNEEAGETFKAPEGDSKEAAASAKMDTGKTSDIAKQAEEKKKRVKAYNDDPSEKNLAALNDVERALGETPTQSKKSESTDKFEELSATLSKLKASYEQKGKKYLDFGGSERVKGNLEKLSQQIADIESELAPLQEEKKAAEKEQRLKVPEDFNTSSHYSKAKDINPSWRSHQHIVLSKALSNKTAQMWKDVHTEKFGTPEFIEKQNQFDKYWKAYQYHTAMAKQKYKKENPDFHMNRFDKEILGVSMTSKSDAR